MRAALLLLLLASCGVAMAETVYISDMLRVGVRAQPNSTDAPITVITSGAAVTVLERQSNYLRVRTEDGTEGWISEVYATAEVPAKMRVQRLEAERDRLKAELEKVRGNLAAGSGQTEQLAAQITTLQEENARLQASVLDLTAKLQQKESGSAWIFYAVAMIGLFLFGILLGIRWNKERVAQRLGGLEL